MGPWPQSTAGGVANIPDKPKKVLVIGSGPIVIGQAAEFDYAGTQACKSLREEGVTTVLVNSNPATIMTDQGIADRVYIEPLTVEVLERIIDRERPDGILPTLGGQTGLNLAVALADAGILERYNVGLLGTPLETIRRSEDRDFFRTFLHEIDEPEPENISVNTMDEARAAAKQMGLPLVVRPAYTLGGSGGGIANTEEEFESFANSGLAASPISQILLERSLVGWKEIEYEVMRDSADNCITICNMENLDPMGVHTGDSIVVAPSQTLSDQEYQMLRSASIKIIRGLGIEGGCNVQFALQPHPRVSKALGQEWKPESPYFVIEVNPRVSRSSALASKATGYPIARVAAKIAVGKKLDEIENAVTKQTTAAFEPAMDYCVLKIPRWPFDKFPHGDRRTTTQMKSTGEVMVIERSFEAALQKGARALELSGRTLLWENSSWRQEGELSLDRLPLGPNDERLWALMSALRQGATVDALVDHTYIDPWFINALERIVKMERRLLGEELTPSLLKSAKRMGFSDGQVGTLADMLPEQVRNQRHEWGLRPVYKTVDTCAAEFEAVTPYYYSTYDQENEAPPLEGKKAVVIGSGPIRIGQGIEFDYCSVHASWALSEAGVKSIMINSNPETVSTDFDASDRLYFEPLDEESVRDILENEEIDNVAPPSVVQFGGQTAINLSQSLAMAGLPILGSSAEAIDMASDRHKFEDFLSRLGIPQPPGAAVTSVEEALKVAQNIGYPAVVRPSYVLGGRAMEIVQNATELIHYLTAAVELSPDKPVLIDRYLEGKECEVDAICDGEEVLIPGIMEHVERAGVHSGDSMAIYPALNLSSREVDTIVDYTTRIGLALGVRGLMNVQFVIHGGPAYRSPMTPQDNTEPTTVYIIEVNPRGSRTIPFISKLTGVPVATLATRVMLGDTLKDQGYPGGLWPTQDLVGVKAPVFSMAKLVGVDWHLGPEMKSTGEVMGVDRDFQKALTKALLAANLNLKPGTGILLSIADQHKAEAVSLVRDLDRAGCRLYATEGTAAMISAMGLPVSMTTKRLSEGHPNVVDVIEDGSVSAVVNTISGAPEVMRDGFYIRRAAVEKQIPCFTSLDTARAAAESLPVEPAAYNIATMGEYLTAR
ncbi:MAG: carbamoyl-phosphate synthase large subunit [Dehalococcoidia bacterium]|jgi:carbamoyl-phosphate synthase large subunit|nr:carbamoyl-phosphate synthase large subunit [Dehalococcoidia bacterium]PKB83417.1 MAG: carbamoyl phosphate synthase large subunit [SAR202 cluster bacterium MP-SInd-SRR3963457-G1]PKB83466.1 MAG: carbamoyl phosphate synthase large subunit [SAR202 cluster bacterium MP-NPac-SRR3961935-G1]